jgi:hypothetical protein
MLLPTDGWAIGEDGSVVVVRANTHSVEWFLPDGSHVMGPPHSFETQPVQRIDKENLLAEMRNSAISTVATASRTGGVRMMSMSRGSPNAGDGPGVDDFEWAETFPVFRNDRTVVSPSGVAWVERWVPFGSDSRWETFDRGGIWLGSVTLPPGRRVIGFGKRADGSEAVYVVRVDEYELKYLERYRVVR